VREVVAQEISGKEQRRTRWTQIALAVAAIIASLAAAFAAYEARSAVGVAEQGVQLQDAQNQLATAVTALGGNTAAQRVAGVTILERNVAEQLAFVTNRRSRENAYSLYTSAIIVLSNYLRSGAPAKADGQCSDVTSDITYAADELEALLALQHQVANLNQGKVAIDLSNVELCNQYWSGIRFDWLSSAYLPDIDLRGANLQKSDWGGAFLYGAHLQCANLAGADLSHATLTDADLRGANLVGATLPATLRDAQLVGAVRDQAASWNKLQCLASKAYMSP
jgi:hypothetical protein